VMEENKVIVTPKKIKNKFIIPALALFVLLVAFISAGIYFHRSTPPLPKTVTGGVNFPVYYPSYLPKGYAFDKSSTHLENQILFFGLSNKKEKISISEQAAPKNPPDFELILKRNISFKKLDLTGGQAIYGVSQNIPAAIILTNTTLINISGSSNIPLDNIAKITQSLSAQ
jgi:hypothetical protein